MTTYPNQKVIHINKNKYTSNFLQVGINEWQEAFKILKPSSFAVYLYLASNADGFDLALSQKAIENALGIKKTAYHNAIAELKEQGYITIIQGNVETFHTTPVRECEPELKTPQMRNEEKVRKNEEKVRKNELPTPQMRTLESAKMNLEVRKNGREIDIIDNIDNINKIDKRNLATPNSSLATQAVKQEKEQVNAVAADKVISVACPNEADSYYYLIKHLQKHNRVLADLVVNSLSFADNTNSKRINKAIAVCANAGFKVDFTDTAAAVANV